MDRPASAIRMRGAVVADYALRPWGRRACSLVGAVAIGLFVAGICGCATRVPRADAVYFPAESDPARVVHLKSFNRLHDLVRPRSGFVESIRGGAISPRVGAPAGIAYRLGYLYICDTHDHAVHVWDLRTGRGRRLTESGGRELVTPVDVAVDDAGTVYVADTGRGEVVVFPKEGGEGRSFKPPDRESYRPVAVAVRDSVLYVADVASHRIDTFSTRDGRWTGGVGGVGSDPGKFYYPMGVAVGPAGRWIAGDMMNARVQVFDAGLAVSRTFGQPGDRYGDMGKPKHVDVGPDGTVFVADAEFAYVHLFDLRGRLLMLVGGPEDRPGGTPMPLGIAVAGDLPAPLASLVPDGFDAAYFFFVTNSVGRQRINLFAVGTGSRVP